MPMPTPHRYQPPREDPRREPTRPRADPESGQRFANWATALGIVAVASVAGSLAAVGGVAWVVNGKGHQVGELGYLAIFVIAALLFAVFAQQVGPTLLRRGRIATVVVLIAIAVAGPSLAVAYRLAKLT